MNTLLTILLILAVISIPGFLAVRAITIIVRKEEEEFRIREQRLINKDYLTDPEICPRCGYKHPKVKEFGFCGTCASQLYGDSPYLHEIV
ncbi:hypothetical protein [Draconibacterium mangrovi]|uniref:hypothetical protein n=1 Tax=Draconibacterium mangrovi TaxID=2697469 RepID=UPI0013D7474D|nr:hypothetical protein [Draconibacterium mangrovi]